MPQKTSPKHHPKRWSLQRYIVIGTLLTLLSIVALVGILFGWGLSRPLAIENTYVLEVPRGATLIQIAGRMQKDGVLDSPWLLTVPGRMKNVQTNIKAGRYRFEAGVTARDVLQRLLSGTTMMARIRLVEGTTFTDFKKILRGSPDIINTVLDRPDKEILQAIGASEPSPEGLFFPDTYSFNAGSTDVVLLRKMYNEMREKLQTAWNDRRDNLPLRTPYEALILASIVEKETNADSDRALIASVLINRLRAGMRLQADPTVIYGLGPEFRGNLRKTDLTSDTPYNTYVRSGLPPTPIATVSQAALEAVLQAPDTKYYYFVARGDGTSEFSQNLADHNRAVAKYILKR